MMHPNHRPDDLFDEECDLATQTSIASAQDDVDNRSVSVDSRQSRSRTKPASRLELLPCSDLDVVNDALDRIGMTRYHWGLFILCGCGWLADNATLQALAIILPQVQLEFSVPTSISGLGTTASFIGMIVGASLWGILSDIYGRRPAFNLTLLLTSVFALVSGFAPTFASLCILLALMGFGLGGNLPCDGALFLEFLPSKKQKLLTLLSVFWPIGQVLSAIAAWALLPGHSCQKELEGVCMSENNRGWRYVMFTLGAMIGFMFIARFFVFRLMESPKYLLARGKRQEALDVLNQLSQQAKMQLDWTIEDLPKLEPDEANESSTSAENHKVARPVEINQNQSSWQVIKDRISEFTPSNIKPLFTKPMARTTILVWLIWILVALGYIMFNAFLPKFLSLHAGEAQRSISEVYQGYLIVSVAGVPGSILGMYLIETRIGRRGTMAISALGTAAGMFLFTTTTSPTTQLVFSSLSATLANIMYGVLYTYTPEVFPANSRGTGTGIASALGRITGSTAPILSGILLNISVNVPLYVASGSLMLATICMILLPIETKGRQAQ